MPFFIVYKYHKINETMLNDFNDWKSISYGIYRPPVNIYVIHIKLNGYPLDYAALMLLLSLRIGPSIISGIGKTTGNFWVEIKYLEYLKITGNHSSRYKVLGASIIRLVYRKPPDANVLIYFIQDTHCWYPTLLDLVMVFHNSAANPLNTYWLSVNLHPEKKAFFTF